MPYLKADDGVRLYYEEAGTGPPLLLLHSSLGDADQWARAGYVDAFRPIARVITTDLRGRGRSDAPHDPARYGVERHAADALALLDALGADRAVVWGHSIGGRIGFELAARHPDRVLGLIATGASGHAFSAIGRALNAASQEIYEAGMAKAAEAFASVQDVPRWMVENWARGDAEAIAASVRANAEWRGAEDAFESLEVPVLLLLGEGDPVLEEARATAARVPRCVLVELEGTDHVSSFARSDVPCAIALEWLRDLWLSPGGDNPVEK